LICEYDHTPAYRQDEVPGPNAQHPAGTPGPWPDPLPELYPRPASAWLDARSV